MTRRAINLVAHRVCLLVLLLVCQLAHLLASGWMLLAVLGGSQRAWTIAIGYDQLANAATGGNVDETISSRASRARKEKRAWGCILCRVLDWIDKDHCTESEGT
jgi:hypothetical protein